MVRQKNDQIPLGEVLTKARLDKNMSRAQLAKETSISENSLVRYEKAGLEKDGQYPPSPKLAKLCFTLDISPLTAMFSSLSRDEFWVVKGYTWENWLMSHPDYEYLVEQWGTLMGENHKLAAALKLMLGPKPEPGSHEAETLAWMKSEARRIIEIQDAFYQRLGDMGFPNNPDGMPLSFPGYPEHKTRKGASSPFDYAELTKNGPDKSPGRSKKSKNNTEAVGAASIKPKKKRNDEAV